MKLSWFLDGLEFVPDVRIEDWKTYFTGVEAVKTFLELYERQANLLATVLGRHVDGASNLALSVPKIRDGFKQLARESFPANEDEYVCANCGEKAESSARPLEESRKSRDASSSLDSTLTGSSEST